MREKAAEARSFLLKMLRCECRADQARRLGSGGGDALFRQMLPLFVIG